ncbi:MAG: LPS-assembly protein LptD [Deltaproteobacteria bacterium]|nr:LPS-assembly protein LptD [Deltaproteobacteria bacterium]
MLHLWGNKVILKKIRPLFLAFLCNLSIFAFTAPAAAAEISTTPMLQGITNGGPCTKLELASENMDCSRKSCILRQRASLFCESIRLWADEIEVQITEQNNFAGAIARSNVLLVEDKKLITCSSVVLGADRIKASMNDAVIRVKAGTDIRSDSKIPLGRNDMVIAGKQIERLGKNQLHIEQGNFTKCDCGGDLPSWSLSSNSIDVTMGERATIWWPVFRISPFGNLQIPITPPMPPLSIPLKSRATGFLPPKIMFYKPPWPMLDLPFFIPLSDSWDLTIIPGIRTDWSLDHKYSPETWGAPRLGARLRYAPILGTEGEFTISWTHDGDHAMVIKAWKDDCDARLKTAKEEADPTLKQELLNNWQNDLYCNPTNKNAFNTALANKIANDPRYDLVERYALSWSHKTDFSKNLRLLLRADWISDDNYRLDFGETLNQQVSVYIPSRLQLQWRSALVSALIGADYLLRVGNTPQKLTNLQSTEYRSPQHGPVMRLNLLPINVTSGFYLDGSFSFERIGPWSAYAAPAYASYINYEPTLFITRAAPALAFSRQLGPLALSARSRIDTAILSGNGPLDDARENTAIINEADASIQFAGKFGQYIHVLTPHISYLGIPWRRGRRVSDLMYRVDGTVSLDQINALLRRDHISHQGIVSLTQDLSQQQLNGLNRLVTLDISQPFNLENQSLLATNLSLNFNIPGLMSGGTEASLYLLGLATKDNPDTTKINESLVWRQFVAWASPPAVGPFSLSATYRRIAPNSGHLLRNIYQFESLPNKYIPGAKWVHYVDTNINLSLPPRFFLSYNTSYYLHSPRENDEADLEKEGLTAHNFSVRYHSPCECWDLTISGSKSLKAINAVDRNWRLNILISVGEYSLGSGLSNQ